MSFVQATTTQSKYIALSYLSTGTLKIALYTAEADINAGTTAYTTSGEVVGTGYVAGGKTLTGVTVAQSGTTAYLDFDNVTWDPANFTARGALIYNTSLGNLAIAVLDFGADKTSTTTFTVQMPSNSASSALIRFS
jgi:hypothetical protein